MQERAPLWEAMCQHAKQAHGSLHVPGHKQGLCWDPMAQAPFAACLPFDLTEVGDLDDLHHPTGAIAEAQQMAAQAFRAAHTFFLVGGSTVGNLATLLALCRPGDGVLMQRSAHQSVYHGCKLAQAIPYFLSPAWDPLTGCELPLSTQTVATMLARYPHIRVVLITSPSYDGIIQPIPELAQICAQQQVFLVVDEAHGAHLGFHPQLPPWALTAGAHVAVQSTHKMLPALTMAAMLHLGEAIQHRAEDFQNALRWVMSSSPSYLLLASLDLARRYMVCRGHALLDALLCNLALLRAEFAQLEAVEEVIPPTYRDPCKILLRRRGGDGFSLATLLQEQGWYVERATPHYALLIPSLTLDTEQIQQLSAILTRLPVPTVGQQDPYPTWELPADPLVVPWSALGQHRMTWRPLTEVVDCIAADFVVPYPPGIPVLLPGERVTREVQTTLLDWLERRGTVRGVRESQIRVLEGEHGRYNEVVSHNGRNGGGR